MSFSSEAKAELCRIKADKTAYAVAECYGILLYCSCFSPNEIRIVTASRELAACLPKLFRKAFGVSFDRLPPEDAAAGAKLSFIISNRPSIVRIYDTFGIDAKFALDHHINLAVLEEEGLRSAFIRGAFLAGGSVTDPTRSFHLELSTVHRSVSREAASILLELGLTPREAARKGNSLLYFKQADMIADFFTGIGAPSTAISILEAKVEREMRNSITRKVNCDSANADKVVNASGEQIDAIHRFAARFGLETLPEALRDTAYLRIANPEASLSDLSQLSYPHVSKSTLSYRLKRIAELADSALKEEQ